MLTIVMFVFGLASLITGRYRVARHVIKGGRARLIGLLLLSPFPLSFLLGAGYGIMLLTSHQTVTYEQVAGISQLLKTCGCVSSCV